MSELKKEYGISELQDLRNDLDMIGENFDLEIKSEGMEDPNEKFNTADFPDLIKSYWGEGVSCITLTIPCTGDTVVIYHDEQCS